jgi:alginate O-acetyltransferase complex protein AlgI
VLLIGLGLVKKMALADQLAQVANQFFSQPAAYPGMLAAWSGAGAFALQVYFDFSGYTDIAIGSARLLGYDFPVNFRRPFLAASMTELWQRWHISLSRWLRDYLFLPLGGFRGGKLRAYRSLLVTMLVGGLWHGAGWNYAVWGAFHGVLLVVEREMGVRRERGTRRLLHPARVLLTFALFVLGTVIFRPIMPGQALGVLGQMFSASAGESLISPWQAALVALWMGLEIWEERKGWFEGLVQAPPWVLAGTLAVLLLTLELLGVVEVQIPFFYYQF